MVSSKQKPVYTEPPAHAFLSIQRVSLTQTKPETGTFEQQSAYEPRTYTLEPSFQNYCDYFKCVAAKGEDYAPCNQFKRAYNALCPSTPPLSPFYYH